MGIKDDLLAAYDRMWDEHKTIIIASQLAGVADPDLVKLIFSTGYLSGANRQLELDRAKFSEIVAEGRT